MRVMGVDPGLTRCGIALVESGAGRAVTALTAPVAALLGYRPGGVR